MTVDHQAGLTIVTLFPRLLDTNGDAANARVLAQRARWAGLPARIVLVHTIADLPDAVDLVVIGSGTDTDLAAARDALGTLAEPLRAWLAGGVPVLAVGTGWELLSAGLGLADGSSVDGLGLVPGRASVLPARVADDLVVDADGLRLLGFENHLRGYSGATATLGAVAYGTGNGDGTEGAVDGSFIGTHLHGPVLARNPQLADRMLGLASAARGLTLAPSAQTESVDGMAKAARNQVAVRLSLTS
ncbi:cobyric acid synthase [Cryobacterium adonitolivorans]|uniref:Lipid II isoglutaminyl synthase (glutamine-hydrolyzing) subunit GatD n=1 Tax=Cryobacterium adonitolivorans TaxID=1259189 RepID=A0A4R8W2W1_9MICO|nr:cobyric acid synthase [Cryobacterium adonitolivorans]TFB99310.1 cobyric acid synthase [Cryobacterium adonitolivorans]